MRYPAKFLSRKSSGQAVLLVILGMAVVLTIVLSVVSRSVTDVSVTKVEEDSSKAFSAAEAGIEKLLIGGNSVSGEDLGNEAFIESAQALTLGKGATSFDFSETYNSGDIATVWFVSHDDTNLQKLICSTDKPCFDGTSFSVHWNENAAVEVVVYYGSGAVNDPPDFSGVKVKRFAFDPDASRRNDNKFSATIASSQQGYSYSSGDISLSGLTRPLFARVKFLYGSVNGFRVTTPTGYPLPSQGRLLVSKGVANNAARQIEVRDYYRSPLGIFEAGIFSQGDLTKN